MLDAIQGTWIPTAAELGGNSFPDDLRNAIKLVVQDGQYTVTVGPNMDKGTVVLDTAAEPKQMTLTGTDGPNQGKTILAVFDLAGDTMRVCYELNGTSYPTEFKTYPGTLTFLVTYRRV